MDWNENLPKIEDWKPRKKKKESFQKALYEKCSHIEQLIKIRAKIESEYDIDNFDSGQGIEDIIREELSKIVPGRYKITNGVVNDKNGYTAGDCDLILMNDTWFSALKDGATKLSRRYHFPIESIYSVIEIKKTLTYKSLDDAMRKLVCSKRLEREIVPEWFITENSHRENKTNEAIRNELFTGIIAVNLGKGLDKKDLFNRFFAISKQLPLSERINSLCIIGHGTITWGYQDNSRSKFKDGIFTVPVYKRDIEKMELFEYVVDEDNNSLIYFIINLLTQLYYSVLNPHNVWRDYSKERNQLLKFEIPKYNSAPNK